MLEQMTGDENDVDEFGMDVRTRKRMKVKHKFSKKKQKPKRPVPSRMPYSLRNI
jgi:hypothetical protein